MLWYNRVNEEGQDGDVGGVIKMAFDPDKFRELLLYVAQRSASDPTFGATKLNKILFFSDFLAYGQLGKSITGATYQRLEHGPAARELLPIQEELVNKSEAMVVPSRYFNRVQKRLWAVRDPVLSRFSAEEISLVDDVIEALRCHNASDASLLSHLIAVGWQIAGDREEIPYEAVFLSGEPPTPTDVKHGQELAQRYGWLAV